MSKSILLLLTWPLGIYLSWSIVTTGLRQDPFALAVHEMFFLLLSATLMLLSLKFSNTNSNSDSKGHVSAIRRTAYYFCLAIMSAAMISLFVILPYSQHESHGGPNTFLIGSVALFLLVLFGTTQAYREAKVKKP